VLANETNVVVITGDIHASYAGTPWVSGDPTKKIVEFVGPAISSGTYKALLTSQVAADPVLSKVEGASALAGAIDTLFKAGPNPHLGFMDSVRHGFVVADVTDKEIVATYYRIGEKEARTRARARTWTASSRSPRTRRSRAGATSTRSRTTASTRSGTRRHGRSSEREVGRASSEHDACLLLGAPPRCADFVDVLQQPLIAQRLRRQDPR
jgi:hypothetical protein